MTMADVAAELKRPAALWREADPGLRRLIFVSFIEMLSVNAYFSLIVPFAKTLGLDSSAVGGLSSILQIVSALVAVGAGVLADRAGRKRLYVAGQFVRLAITLALLTTRSYFGLVLVFVFRGLATIQSPAQQAMTASLTRRDNRATMLGLSQTLSQLAAVIMPLASGAIADRYGARVSFLISGVLAVIAIIIGTGLRERPASEAVAAPPTGNPAAAQPTANSANEPLAARIRHMFSGKRGTVLALLMAVTAVNGLCNGAVNILLPYTIMDRFSSAYTVVASAGSLMALGTMFVLLVGGRLADLGGRRKMIMTSGVIFPLIFLPVLFIKQYWQLALILTLTNMVGNISSPAVGAIYMEAVEDQDRGMFAGVQMSLNAAGMALGSLISGFAYKLSPNGAWVGVIALWFLQIVFFHFAVPHDAKAPQARCECESATAGLDD